MEIDLEDIVAIEEKLRIVEIEKFRLEIQEKALEQILRMKKYLQV